jgi:ribosomal protein RSM22 (predicted rRNA methylase)
VKTFANLPIGVESAISELLSQQNSDEWLQHAISLHEEYADREKSYGPITLKSIDDTLAYLALRTPATFAQIYSTFTQIQELIPSWQPKTLLDLGAGPGTGSWAANEIWPSITESLSLDRHYDFLTIGKQIESKAELQIEMQWQQKDFRESIETDDKTYDVVLISNVLNELSPAAADKLIGQALNKCSGILVVIEPGTPFGSGIAQNAASKLAKAGTLLAPYIDNSFVPNDTYYLHFSQRFIRPEFERRVRQHMRDASLMASDWEDTKYAYTVISKIPSEKKIWGRSVGPLAIQKGFLEVPILTEEKIEKIKVMKRHKEQYAFAKDLRWGDFIETKDLIQTPSALPSKLE